MWTAQFFPLAASADAFDVGGLGTMGFSLPASMESHSGRSDLPIISISGDGGIQMNSRNLATISQHNLPIKILYLE